MEQHISMSRVSTNSATCFCKIAHVFLNLSYVRARYRA